MAGEKFGGRGGVVLERNKRMRERKERERREEKRSFAGGEEEGLAMARVLGWGGNGHLRVLEGPDCNYGDLKAGVRLVRWLESVPWKTVAWAGRKKRKVVFVGLFET